jgi:hypothetical protein
VRLLVGDLLLGWIGSTQTSNDQRSKLNIMGIRSSQDRKPITWSTSWLNYIVCDTMAERDEVRTSRCGCRSRSGFDNLCF